MKYLALGFIVIGGVSCAHKIEKPLTVEFPYARELLVKVQQSVSRAPASFDTDDVEQMSTRRVYFSALYHQYLTLGKHLGKEGDVNFCPQFHHDKLQTDSGISPTVTLHPTSEVRSEERQYFPELAFNQNFSLKDYHLTLKSEIETLCEDGASDNYYKFDNLVTHYANKGSFHRRPEAMASVLKIPIFANFYLVKMLEVPGFKNLTSPEEKRFIKLTHTEWFEQYVTEAGQMRSNFIKNKMVWR